MEWGGRDYSGRSAGRRGRIGRMRGITANPWRVAGWAAPVALSLLLVTSAVRFTANSLPVWEALFERHQVSARTGITPEGLADVGRQVQAYFNSGDEPLRVTAEAWGEWRDLFNADETSHMADVKALFRRVYLAQTGAALLLGALTIIGAWRLRGSVYGEVARWLRRGAAITAAAILALGLWSVVAFDSLFTLFHYIGFPQGNWQFDPRTDYLVRVFPFGFWRDVTLFIGVLSLLGAALLWTVGLAARLLAGGGGGALTGGATDRGGLARARGYPNEAEARMAEGMLRDAGIRCVVRPERGGYGLWGQDSFGPHAVWTLREQAEEANRVLGEDE